MKKIIYLVIFVLIVGGNTFADEPDSIVGEYFILENNVEIDGARIKFENKGKKYILDSSAASMLNTDSEKGRWRYSTDNNELHLSKNKYKISSTKIVYFEDSEFDSPYRVSLNGYDGVKTICEDKSGAKVYTLVPIKHLELLKKNEKLYNDWLTITRPKLVEQKKKTEKLRIIEDIYLYLGKINIMKEDKTSHEITIECKYRYVGESYQQVQIRLDFLEDDELNVVFDGWQEYPLLKIRESLTKYYNWCEIAAKQKVKINKDMQGFMGVYHWTDYDELYKANAHIDFSFFTDDEFQYWLEFRFSKETAKNNEFVTIKPDSIFIDYTNVKKLEILLSQKNIDAAIEKEVENQKILEQFK